MGFRKVGNMTDAINPPHYTAHPTGIECIDVIEWMPFNRGAAVKYIWRAGMKDDEIQDLEKAKWFIEREIKRLHDLRRKDDAIVVEVGTKHTYCAETQQREATSLEEAFAKGT